MCEGQHTSGAGETQVVEAGLLPGEEVGRLHNSNASILLVNAEPICSIDREGRRTLVFLSRLHHIAQNGNMPHDRQDNLDYLSARTSMQSLHTRVHARAPKCNTVDDLGRKMSTEASHLPV